MGRILRDSDVETIEFRASLVIGTGSLSFDLVKSLTDRLPVMLCPSWLTTPTQPIAVDAAFNDDHVEDTLGTESSSSRSLPVGSLVSHGIIATRETEF